MAEHNGGEKGHEELENERKVGSLILHFDSPYGFTVLKFNLYSQKLEEEKAVKIAEFLEALKVFRISWGVLEPAFSRFQKCNLERIFNFESSFASSETFRRLFKKKVNKCFYQGKAVFFVIEGPASTIVVNRTSVPVRCLVGLLLLLF